jgi:hypothetical protein
MTSMQQNIIYQGNSVISIETIRKLRLIAYVLVFLHASFAVFFLNGGFAHAQNTIQVSESAQEQEKRSEHDSPANCTTILPKGWPF